MIGPPPSSPNAALLIDFDNVTMGIRSDLQSELKNLLASDIIKGKVQLRRAYADWRRYPQYVAPLAESSIDMIMAPAYGSSKKNATDIRLAIDALELVFTRPEIGTYILLSGDSDFSTLVIKLKEYGKYVIGVGMRESSSDLLVMNCDEYYSYSALAGLVLAGSEEDTASTRRDPWELVSEAMTRMQRNGDVMRADRLKQVMQDLDSTFDEKNLGMSKFSRFVQEAAQRGLVALTKLPNGQLEVGPPRAAGSPATSSGAQLELDAEPMGAPAGTGENHDAAGTSVDAEGRARRGRRGRGGRGRGRSSGARDEVVGGMAPSASGGGDVHAPMLAGPTDGTSAGGAGSSGERLTRDEAFALVRQATEALAHGDEAVPVSAVREKALDLLGRDSASLAEHNFARVLRDAHDADLIDLRRRGDDYEVAMPAVVSPVAEQLNVAAAARTSHTSASPASPATATGQAAPAPTFRGMRPRGVGGAARRSTGRPSVPPPELLTVGVVEPSPAASMRADAADHASSEVHVERAGEPGETAESVANGDGGEEGKPAPRARRTRARSPRSRTASTKKKPED